MAIVLAIAAIMIATAASVGAARIEAQRIKTTRERIQYIFLALDQYARTYQHLPCPADGTLAVTSTSYGYGAGTDTDGGNCSASNLLTSGSGNIKTGTVPFKELGLSSIVANDGWDRRFTYAVDQDLTFVDRDSPAVNGYTASAVNGSISITYGTGTPNTIGAVAIISHGQNGYGAWPGRGGSRLDPTGGDNREDENADGDNELGHYFPYSTGGTFDDLLEIRDKWQIAP